MASRKFLHSTLALVMTAAMLLSPALSPVQAAPLAQPIAPMANPDPVQTFYVTLPEGDALTVLSAIHSAAVSPTYTYFSIAVAADDTWVYYDHWEDGYEADIANPTQPTTQIWGNGKAADGCAPNKSGVPVTCTDANDVLNAGDVIVPYNAVPIPRNSSNILFDAKDKVAASKSIAMARATWASGSNTLNAFGHEMYATSEWGLIYEAPVGTDTANAGQTFEYSAFTIMAGQNGTTVQVDADANGSFETTTTLNEGGAILVPGVKQGARVEADKPVQVVLMTGDIGSTYASRDMTLLPTSVYGSSYWSPVGTNTGNTNNPTRLFLYNPNASSIYITCKYPGSDNYRDQFGVAAYNNSNGSLNWSGQSWTEVGDDGNPATGTTLITGGVLRFNRNSAQGNAIWRKVGDLSSHASVTLSFTLDGNRIDGASDAIAVEVSGNGGGSWTTLQQFNSDPNGDLQSYDVTAYKADLAVRFIMVGSGLTGNNERWDIDNVDIAVPAIAQTTQSVGAKGVVTQDLANNQGAHCYASDASGNPTNDKIAGVGIIDVAGTAADWSFTMYPDNFLTTDALVGLGLGRDPNSGTNPNENGSPLWVTAACPAGTWVYVDWDNNGEADPVDTNGDRNAEVGTEDGIFVGYLQSVRLFRPAPANLPYAQTGARIWSRTASGMGDYDRPDAEPGCNLALAWGQDTRTATAGAPGLDVGTSVPPLRLVESSKSLTLKTDNDGDGQLSPGDVATYLITVKNSGPTTVNNVYVYDTVPANTTYVQNSTEKATAVGGPWTAIADQGSAPYLPLAQTQRRSPGQPERR